MNSKDAIKSIGEIIASFRANPEQIPADVIGQIEVILSDVHEDDTSGAE